MQDERLSLKSHGPVIVGHDDQNIDDAIGRMSLTAYHSASEVPTLTSHEGLCNSLETNQPDKCGMREDNSTSNGIATVLETCDPAFSGHRQSQCRVSLYGCEQQGIHMFSWPMLKPHAKKQERAVTHIHRPHNNSLLQPVGSSIGNGSRQTNEYPLGHHNVVDVDRIRQGLDVRTTVRLSYHLLMNTQIEI